MYPIVSSGPVTVLPGPFAGLQVVKQPAFCKAGVAMRQQPSVSLIDAYQNDIFASAVPGVTVDVYAALAPSSPAAVGGTLFREACSAACERKGSKLVCSDSLRSAAAAADCANVAIARAGVPAAFMDLTVDVPGTFRITFKCNLQDG
jgi:hypothetical protein